MEEPLVLCGMDDNIGILTVNNPPLNLITVDLTRKLSQCLDQLAGDSSVRVLVVTGAGGRAFCAGSNVKEFPVGPGRLVEQKLAFENATFSKLDDFPKPTIAALNGLAFGGGLELAVCCDILVAGQDVRLALPEVKLGVFPGSGGTVRVTRRIGEGRAKELMYFGEPIDAQTAFAWGLVNRVVAPGMALSESLELARILSTRPNFALQLCKRAVDMALDMTEDDAIAKSLPLSDAAANSHDGLEGVRAFLAKRSPEFRHI